MIYAISLPLCVYKLMQLALILKKALFEYFECKLDVFFHFVLIIKPNIIVKYCYF